MKLTVIKNNYSFPLILFIVSVCSMTTLQSCIDKTPLSEANQEYVGKWHALDGTLLQIYTDGTGSFKKNNASVEGGSCTIKNDLILIELFGIKGKFSIDKPPFEENGKWKMKLNGVEYSREPSQMQPQ